jgi:hypothetical protein
MTYDDEIYQTAYREAVSDMMMEMHICESQAIEQLNEILTRNPNALDYLYKQFQTIKNQMRKI